MKFPNPKVGRTQSQTHLLVKLTLTKMLGKNRMLAKDKNKEKDAVLKMKEGNTEEEGVEKAN